MAAEPGGGVAGATGGASVFETVVEKRLDPLTRQAFDRMWGLQRADGGWQWPFRDIPPFKR